MEWSYLEAIMLNMSFFVEMAVMDYGMWEHNYIFGFGQWLPYEGVSIGQGPQAGGPLSPFLFLPAAIGLNMMLKVCIFSGYGVGGSSPFRISHLQFVVDALIMREKKSWGNFFFFFKKLN